MGAIGIALPSIVAIILVAMFFQGFKDNIYVSKFFMGVRPAVVALIASPCFKMAKTAGITYANCWIPLVSSLFNLPLWRLAYMGYYLCWSWRLYLRAHCIMRHSLRYFRHSGSVIYKSKLPAPSVSMPCDYHILQSSTKEQVKTCPFGDRGGGLLRTTKSKQVNNDILGINMGVL